jgi:hypothetical protein
MAPGDTTVGRTPTCAARSLWTVEKSWFRAMAAVRSEAFAVQTGPISLTRTFFALSNCSPNRYQRKRDLIPVMRLCC